MKRQQLRCPACRSDTSAPVGTIFEGGRKPLRSRFLAGWRFTSKGGVSAEALHGTIKTTLKAAQTWLDGFRGVMAPDASDRLHKAVEVGTRHVQWRSEKVLIAVAAEIPSHGDRLILRPIPDLGRDTLHGFVREGVAPGAEVRTNAWIGYALLDRIGYVHIVIPMSSAGRADVPFPALDRAVSGARGWIKAIGDGRAPRNGLAEHLNEYTFRARHKGRRDMIFYRLIERVISRASSSDRPRKPHDPSPGFFHGARERAAPAAPDGSLLFADQLTDAAFDGERPPDGLAPCSATLWRAVQRKLDCVLSADRLQDLASPVWDRLKAISGGRGAEHSLRINDQYRFRFRWTEHGAEAVQIVEEGAEPDWHGRAQPAAEPDALKEKAVDRMPKSRPPTHPGEVLLKEFLEPLEISQVAPAERIHISIQRLNGIVNGKRGVTPDTALRLAKVFNVTPAFWLTLQSRWDLHQAMMAESSEDIAGIEPMVQVAK